MLEWLTYSISDFVLFSPEVYWRLVSRYLTELSYFPSVIAVSYLALFYCLAKQTRLKWVCLYFALMWAWLGWQFYLEHYLSINWFAKHLGYACLLQALLMMIASWRIENHKHNQIRNHNHKPRSHYHLAYMATIAATLVLIPILASTVSLPWSLGLIGLMPIPTALITLMLLIQACISSKRKWWLILCLLPMLILTLELLTLDQLSWQLISRY